MGETAMAYEAPALDKGLDVVELLMRDGSALTIVEIARHLGRTHNELYRMVVVLERRGYITRSASDRYAASGKLFDLAMRRAPHRNLHDAALPIMRKLAQQLWQSCHLVVISETDIVVVARTESPDLLGFAVRVGYRRPLVRSTSGRVIYAYLDEYSRTELAPRLHATIETASEWADFLADVAIARENGLFVGPSAHIPSITDIGAPVIDHGNGGVLASLIVPWVSGSSPRGSIEDAMTEVRASANEIASALAVEQLPTM